LKVIPVLLASLVFVSFLSEDIFAKRGREGHREYRKRGHGPHGQRPCRDCRGICFGNPKFLKDKLNLSDKQLDTIGDINKKYRIKMLDIREKLSPMKFRLKKLLLQDNIDIKKVRNVLEEMAKLKVEIRLLRIKQRVEIEKNLTLEQRKKLRAEKRMRRKGNRRRHWDR
ncbi:Spy/CpxP family protein refolding chaperone, partial [Spirochaetota bacterium]